MDACFVWLIRCIATITIIANTTIAAITSSILSRGNPLFALLYSVIEGYIYIFLLYHIVLFFAKVGLWICVVIVDG
ncbi:hypothetical protein EBU71_10720 [bacterium]|nr:hypothetical protein [Candidatus Elulimicrobium humile]